MTGGLAIFVKTPSYSPLKTRLAASVGSDTATQWYVAASECVQSIAEQAQHMKSISAYWAVAEAAAISDNVWQGFPALAQGEGGLGERMGRVHRMLVRQHGVGILIGADAPQLCAEDLLQAYTYLSQPSPRIVMGPASDGGFWLIGANYRIPMDAWTTVEYSQANTRRDFLAQLENTDECLSLRTLTDVDTETDLALCYSEMASLEKPTAAQIHLSQLMHAMHSRVDA